MPSGSLAKSRAEHTVSIVLRAPRMSREELLTILFRELQQAFKIAGRDQGMTSFSGITVLHLEERVADQQSASSKARLWGVILPQSSKTEVGCSGPTECSNFQKLLYARSLMGKARPSFPNAGFMEQLIHQRPELVDILLNVFSLAGIRHLMR